MILIIPIYKGFSWERPRDFTLLIDERYLHHTHHFVMRVMHDLVLIIVLSRSYICAPLRPPTCVLRPINSDNACPFCITAAAGTELARATLVAYVIIL